MNPSLPQPADAAFRAILATYGLITRLMHDHFAAFGITGAKWGVLRTLHRAEMEGHEALRLIDLGERLLVRPPSVTMLVSRLRREGLVATHASSHDRRAKVIALTPAGRLLVDRVLKVHPQRIARVMNTLNTDEQAALQRLLSRLNDHLRGLIALEPDAGVVHPGRRRAS